MRLRRDGKEEKRGRSPFSPDRERPIGKKNKKRKRATQCAWPFFLLSFKKFALVSLSGWRLFGAARRFVGLKRNHRAATAVDRNVQNSFLGLLSIRDARCPFPFFFFLWLPPCFLVTGVLFVLTNGIQIVICPEKMAGRWVNQTKRATTASGCVLRCAPAIVSSCVDWGLVSLLSLCCFGRRRPSLPFGPLPAAGAPLPRKRKGKEDRAQ